MEFEAMKRRELLELCRQHGLATRGCKADLAASLAGAISFDQPIPSDSCSSNVPSQKRRNSRLKLNAMDDTYSKGHGGNRKIKRTVRQGGGAMMKALEEKYSKSCEENTKVGKHLWEHEEVTTLLKKCCTLVKELPYQANKPAFHTRLAQMMNEHYANKKAFNARMIRGKLEIHEKRWFEQAGSSDKIMLSAKRIPLGTYHSVFASLFGEARVTVPRKRTSTGALKSSSTVDMNVPRDKETALYYLTAHSECDPKGKGVETLMFSYILDDKNVLDAFVANAKIVETYEERKKFLADLKKNGVMKTPQLAGIDPKLLPPDFR